MTEDRLVALLKEKDLHISAAESCTGGLVCSRIVNVPGSSAVFDEGFITYANRAKHGLLGVPEEILAAHGAVSPECARAMAEGCAAAAGADIALSVTGIAGPDGGTSEKPVGLVFIGVKCFDQVLVKEYRFRGSRAQVRERTAAVALNTLRRMLLGERLS